MIRIFTGLLMSVICASLTATAQVNPGKAVVRSITGSATYTDGLGFEQPLALGTVLKEGQTVKTGADGNVDLFLAENGPGVSLNPSSTLKFNKLSTSVSPLGTLIDTQLDLQQGQMYGNVQKLLPGSRYEVNTPQGLAVIRGTEFYMDTRTGQIIVTSGTVNVTVKLDLPSGTDPVRTISVPAGKMLSIPSKFKNEAEFYALTTANTPPGMSLVNLEKLRQLGRLVRFRNSSTTVGGITEVFEATKDNTGKIEVSRPPDIGAVSP